MKSKNYLQGAAGIKKKFKICAVLAGLNLLMGGNLLLAQIQGQGQGARDSIVNSSSPAISATPAPFPTSSSSPDLNLNLKLMVRKIKRGLWTPPPPPPNGWMRIL